MLKIVFWDNDGILVDTEGLYFAANRDTLAPLGIQLTPEQHHQYSFSSNRGIWPLLVKKGYDEAMIQALRNARNRRYLEMLRTEPIDVAGARDVLESLHGRVRMAMVTSSMKDHLVAIHDRTGFLDLMEFILANGDYTESKPAPAPYLKALEKAGVQPHEALVIEDSQRGLEAAKAAGIPCWVIPGELTKQGDFSGARRRLDSITQVPELIEPMLER